MRFLHYVPDRSILSSLHAWAKWARNLGHWRAHLITLGEDEKRVDETVDHQVDSLDFCGEQLQWLDAELRSLLDWGSPRPCVALGYDGLAASLFSVAIGMKSPRNAASTHPGSISEHVMTAAVVDLVVELCSQAGHLTAEVPDTVPCIACSGAIRWPGQPELQGQRYSEGWSQHDNLVRAYSLQLCQECLFALHGGRDSRLLHIASKRDLDAASLEGIDSPVGDEAKWLRRLVDCAGRIPSREEMQNRGSGMLPAIALGRRAVHSDPGLLLALANTNSYAWYKDVYGSWLKALHALGVVEGAMRVGRYGYRMLASDGHECNSLWEYNIEKHLIEHGIVHIKEPLYPVDPHLNPRGRLRADWQIAETFVEFFGMMDDASYRKRAERKRVLARTHRLKLVEIYPSDMSRLDDVLGPLVA